MSKPQVWGPFPQKGKRVQSWRVRWRNSDGSNGSKCLRTKEAADSLISQLRGETPRGERPQDLPADTSAWWEGKLAMLGARLLAAQEAGDEALSTSLQRAGRVLAQLASAAAKHTNTAGLERRLMAVEKQQVLRSQARKHGTGREPLLCSRTQPVPGTPVPGIPVFVSGNPGNNPGND